MAAVENFGQTTGLNSPYENGFAITKSDADELTYVTRGIYIGGAGNINCIMANGETVLFTAMLVGVIYPLRIKQVLSTSTTATLMVGLY
jgi:hypothetical protein